MTPADCATTDTLRPCPFCGHSDGYYLRDGNTFRWWLVDCKHCGGNVTECRSDQSTTLNATKPERWYAADHEWNEAGAYAAGLRAALTELVRLKDLKARLTALHEMGHGTDYGDYHIHLSLAWEAARAALTPEPAP